MSDKDSTDELDARKAFERQREMEREFSSEIDAAFGVMSRAEADTEFERLRKHHAKTPSVSTEDITAAFTEIFEATGSSVFRARRREFQGDEDDG